MAATVSIIIPALNAEETLAATLDSTTGALEVIVVDGGSRDRTAAIATDFGTKLVDCKPGRGGQLNVGAAAARGDVLLFLHADTCLPATWLALVQTLPRGRLGAFRFRVAASGFRLWVLERCVALRCLFFRLPYGDQALTCWREDFPGFADLPLMEDVELVRRMPQVHFFAGSVRTSARRWQSEGVWHRCWRNIRTFHRYRRGVPPAQLVAFYDGQAK